MLQVISIVIIIVAIAFLYKRYENKYLYRNVDENMDLRKYLSGKLSRDDLGRVRKPIMWIYTPYEYNSRNWLSFGSRSSYELNQPYLYLTTKSIIKQCNQDFHIVIIDDNTFSKLLPDWKYENQQLTNTKRLFGLMNLLYTYGGIITPISFVCFKSLIEMYYNGTRTTKMFVCENVNKNTLINASFVPDPFFMGAIKETPILKEFIVQLNNIIQTDYTAEPEVTGKIQQWLHEKTTSGKINLVKGYDTSIMKKDGSPVLIDNLMGSDYVNIDLDKSYGIWVPANEILRRTSFEWFARLSEEQVLNSNVILGKYILKSIAPKNSPVSQDTEPSDYVSLWKTPLYKGIYGLQPLYLGQDVPKVSSETKNSNNNNVNKNTSKEDKKYKYVGIIS